MCQWLLGATCSLPILQIVSGDVQREFHVLVYILILEYQHLMF